LVAFGGLATEPDFRRAGRLDLLEGSEVTNQSFAGAAWAAHPASLALAHA
jgi:hypothetical protein